MLHWTNVDRIAYLNTPFQYPAFCSKEKNNLNCFLRLPRIWTDYDHSNIPSHFLSLLWGFSTQLLLNDDSNAVRKHISLANSQYRFYLQSWNLWLRTAACKLQNRNFVHAALPACSQQRAAENHQLCEILVLFKNLWIFWEIKSLG